MVYVEHLIAGAYVLERVVGENLLEPMIVLHELGECCLEYGLAVFEIRERPHYFLVYKVQRFFSNRFYPIEKFRTNCGILP